jgi:hypothetical protein
MKGSSERANRSKQRIGFVNGGDRDRREEVKKLLMRERTGDRNSGDTKYKDRGP